MPFPRKWLLFDLRGGDRTATRARCAPGFARTLAGAASATRRRRRGARARCRFAGRLRRRRLQPPDALALAGRPRHRGRRLCAALAQPAEDRLGRAAVRGRSRRGLRAPLPARALPLARAGELGRARDHGRGEGLRANARRPVRRELLPDAPRAPLHRLGQARGPARRHRPLPHAAPARHRRPADRCRLLRAFPRAAAAAALGLPRRPARRREPRDVHDQPPRDAREHRRPRGRRGADPAPLGPPREQRAGDLPRRDRRRARLLRLLPGQGRVPDLDRVPDRGRAALQAPLPCAPAAHGRARSRPPASC